VFRGLISDAKAAAGAVIVKYVGPRIGCHSLPDRCRLCDRGAHGAAGGRYGAQIAYLLLAGGFTLFGMVAALVVTVKEQEEEVAEAQAEAEGTPAVAKEVAMQAPLRIAQRCWRARWGPRRFGIAKLLGRNLPLVLLLVVGGSCCGQASRRPTAKRMPPCPNRRQRQGRTVSIRRAARRACKEKPSWRTSPLSTATRTIISARSRA
jgi:hypothetical protein